MGLSFYERHRLNFEMASALFSLIMSVLGIFFIYRWGVLLMKADQETKDALLGKTINKYIGDPSIIVIIVGVYIVFKIMAFLVSASNWQEYLIFSKKKQDQMVRKSKRNEALSNSY